MRQRCYGLQLGHSVGFLRINGIRFRRQDRDIYLLENIFADADPSVAALLMERVIGGLLSAKTRVVVSSFAPCVAAAQRVITLEGGQAIHGAGADAQRHGRAAAPDVGRAWREDERWQVRHDSEPTWA